MNAAGENIIIVNLTRLGDLLQTSPVIHGLKRERPNCKITLVAEKNFAEVCEGIPGLDRIYRLNLDQLGNQLLAGGAKLVAGFSYVEQVVEELRRERFTMGLNFSSSRMTAVFMGLLRVPDLRGWSMTSDGFRIIAHPWSRLFATMCLNRGFAVYNLVDYYLRMAGIQPSGGGLYYTIPESARTSAIELLRQVGWREGERMVAVQLGASRSARCWPPEHFVELGKQIRDKLNARIVLIGGRLDRELASQAKAALGGRAINLCGSTSIGELGAVLEQSAALVTGDTGPMHMAVAAGIPVVGLFFGPASPFDTGPYSSDNVVLHASVPCAPCDHNVDCLRPYCREEIKPDMVAETLRLLLLKNWTELSKEAGKWGSVAAYRTGFDSNGFYGCKPVCNRTNGEDELVREAYRRMWLAEIDDYGWAAGEKPGCWPRDGCWQSPTAKDIGGGAGEAFAELVESARKGFEIARILAAEVRSSQPSISSCEELVGTLEKIDGAITTVAGIAPAAAPLAQMFNFGKENLEGEDPCSLAEKTCALYSELGRQAATMREMLVQAKMETKRSSEMLKVDAATNLRVQRSVSPG